MMNMNRAMMIMELKTVHHIRNKMVRNKMVEVELIFMMDELPLMMDLERHIH